MKFAAIQFEGRLTHVSGLGATQAEAIKEAHRVADVSGGLRIVPLTKAAWHAVERLGGTAGDGVEQVVTLALVTAEELKALEMLREIDDVIGGAYGRANELERQGRKRKVA